MVYRVSPYLAVLSAALLLAGCAGMGQRYAQNYATYSVAMGDCTANPTTITVPGPDGATTTIEQPNPACNSIRAPEHELKYVGPIISQSIASGIGAATAIYSVERTTSSNEHIAEINADARIAESGFEAQTLQKAFEVAGPRITGTGNAVASGTGSGPATAMPPPEPPAPEMPAELTEGL